MDENPTPHAGDATEVSDAESLLDAYLANAFALPAVVAALGDDEEELDEDDLDGLWPNGPARAGFPALPLRPMNLALLTSLEALVYWPELDRWVNDILRRDYGLGITEIPPLWHRHAELRWELSALHTSWLAAYDPEASTSAPVAWHRELREARSRLSDWTGRSGTSLKEDRPTPVTLWPGEPCYDVEETWKTAATNTPILDRAADFTAWVEADVARRRALENQARATLRATAPTLGGQPLPGRDK